MVTDEKTETNVVQIPLPFPSGAFHYASYSSGGVSASVLAPTGVEIEVHW